MSILPGGGKALCKSVVPFVSCAAHRMGRMVTRVLDLPLPTLHHSLTHTQRDHIKSLLQPGDIILRTFSSYPLWQLIEYFAVHSVFSHAMFYAGPHVIEAQADVGVRGISAEDALSGPIYLAVVRPPYQSRAQIAQAVAFCKEQIGKPFDHDFDLQHERDRQFYCASLVYRALREADPSLEVPLRTFMHRSEVVPDSFVDMPGGSIVYRDKACLWRTVAGTVPLAAGMTVVGALALNGGALVGGAAYVLAGNIERLREPTDPKELGATHRIPRDAILAQVTPTATSGESPK